MPTPLPHIKLSYSKTEYASSTSELQHDIVAESLEYFGIRSHIEITSFADIPTVGTGLGASSTFAVCLAHALQAHKMPHIDAKAFDPTHTRLHAQHIELTRVKSPIGIQDHIAAAHGGFLYAEYGIHEGRPRHGVRITTLEQLSTSSTFGSRWDELAACLFLVKMPERLVSANEILKTPMPVSQITELADIARHATQYVSLRDVRSFGRLLHEAWQIKRTLHPAISTSTIDTVYQQGLDFGLLGGKLLGAGNGGYLLFCAPDPQLALRAQQELYRDYTCYSVNFDYTGVRIVYDDRRNQFNEVAH
jgi:D-glycero-alpha-D-manno-heptose-7-phosphate kinase